jgi:hypothetical protein
MDKEVNSFIYKTELPSEEGQASRQQLAQEALGKRPEVIRNVGKPGESPEPSRHVNENNPMNGDSQVRNLPTIEITNKELEKSSVPEKLSPAPADNMDDKFLRSMAQLRMITMLLNIIPTGGTSLWSFDGEDSYRGMMVPLENVGLMALSPRTKWRRQEEEARKALAK